MILKGFFLTAAVSAEASGLNNQMWATIVDRDGNNVCVVAFSGVNRDAHCPREPRHLRPKANAANAFRLDSSSSSNGSGQPAALALSTSNLYSASGAAAFRVFTQAIRWTQRSPIRPIF